MFRKSAIALILFFGSLPLAGQAKHWKEIEIPPLREFRIQQPVRIELPNGMLILLQEDRELPLIGGTALIRGGGRDVPAGKTGLIGIYGSVWRTGGTTTRTGDQLDDILEAKAASVETSGSQSSTSVSFDALKEDFDFVFGIFDDVLRNPAFREDKIALAKAQTATGIARRNDDPGQIASREAVRIAYGPDSPYSRITEYSTLAAISREDLVAWHSRTVHPNNIILGIVGDFDAKQMEAKLRKRFGGWKRGPAVETVEMEFADPRPGVYFIAKEDVNQSSIRMVHLGIRRDNPDYFAVEVLNEIFSSGGASRLFASLRSRQGLAYSVGGGVGAGYDYPGLFTLSMGTKSESTAAAIEGLREELRILLEDPITAEEVARAKQAILNSYVFRFDSKSKVISEQMSLAFYDYPADFTARFRAGVEGVTAEDVKRVARKYVHPERIALVVVGNPAGFDKPLTAFGEVTPIDITIPPPPAPPSGGDGQK